jgi:predicted RNA binding protein YcfA (HicA-like mRNA interferase family)
MTPEAIAALRNALPDALRPSDPELTWPDEVAHVPEGDDLWDEVEEDLFPTDDPDDPDPLADTPDSQLPSDGGIEDAGSIEDRLTPDGYGPVDDVSGRLREHFGGDWPGAPGGAAALPGGSGITVGPRGSYPSPDVYAFYLPWHRFSPNLWGIYLLVDGIAALGRDIHKMLPRILSRADARRAARLFLYHHEAYHNAVETFAARVEVSHRLACYLTGVQTCFASLLPVSSLHEEGLANVYAHDKVRQYLFAQVKTMSAARRRVKRVAAATALRRLFRLQAPAYASAERILRSVVTFEAAQHELQETCHTLSSLRAPPMVPGIWSAAPRSMAPSLARNKSFSYVISHAHPAIRLAAQVPQFDRREVVRRLRVATGGQEDGGGEHPKLVLPSGKRVPVPGHRDLARGTTRKILRDAGIPMPLTRFMGASDNELRGVGAAVSPALAHHGSLEARV